MSIDRLFDSIDQARNAAHWKSAFGEPQVVDEMTVIPVAQVSYGFGLGFGSGSSAPENEEGTGAGGEGTGGGGGASAKPRGVIVVAPDGVYFEEAGEDTKVAILGIAFAAFLIFQVAKTLRAIFGRQ